MSDTPPPARGRGWIALVTTPAASLLTALVLALARGYETDPAALVALLLGVTLVAVLFGGFTLLIVELLRTRRERDQYLNAWIEQTTIARGSIQIAQEQMREAPR